MKDTQKTPAWEDGCARCSTSTLVLDMILRATIESQKGCNLEGFLAWIPDIPAESAQDPGQLLNWGASELSGTHNKWIDRQS